MLCFRDHFPSSYFVQGQVIYMNLYINKSLMLMEKFRESTHFKQPKTKKNCKFYCNAIQEVEREIKANYCET